MKNLVGAWFLDWKRYLGNAIDVLVAAFAFLVVYATIDGAADFMEFVVAAVIAVIGVGVLLEPDAVASPARGIGE